MLAEVEFWNVAGLKNAPVTSLNVDNSFSAYRFFVGGKRRMFAREAVEMFFVIYRARERGKFHIAIICFPCNIN
jgi:hypothetical protein